MYCVLGSGGWGSGPKTQDFAEKRRKQRHPAKLPSGAVSETVQGPNDDTNTVGRSEQVWKDVLSAFYPTENGPHRHEWRKNGQNHPIFSPGIDHPRGGMGGRLPTRDGTMLGPARDSQDRFSWLEPQGKLRHAAIVRTGKRTS